MIKKKRKNKITANESERIILQLYYLNKKKKSIENTSRAEKSNKNSLY